MKLKEIHRTSNFSWSPSATLPLLATGTVAGALDESFSNESQLEIWAPDFLDRDEFYLGVEDQHGPKGQVKDTARFNRLAWGPADGNRLQGVIAAGLENGELALWDPAKILEGAGTSQSLILRNTTHTGPVRGLDFNPIQTNLLASGGINGEVYIWDLKDPSKPYSPTPGARSTKLDEITSVAWNQQVQYVLAGASSTGYTVVWDLRGKREVVALAYGGGAGTLAGQVGSGTGMAVGGRRGMSDIAWHPDNATRVVTASEDDSSPIIMVWDLRNARAPEKILTGHEKGVLSLSWCKQDADLLLSCGKDNRALCWNPQTSEVIGELPSADNWAFQVDWCPRNPDMLATAFFDGTIGIHSIQSTNEIPGDSKDTASRSDGADIFNTPGFSSSSQSGTLSLKQPPKWLRRPVSSSFGFGGKLVTVSNLTSSQGKSQSGVVNIRKVVTETELVERAKKLQSAIDGDTLQEFAEGKTEGEGWKALLSLFKANSRDELVTLLGFSKSEIASRVVEAVENLKASAEIKSPFEDQDTVYKPHESVVSFAEPEREEFQSNLEEDESAPVTVSEEKTPSEVSVSVTSDTASAIPPTDGESATTAPSLFGDDVLGTPQVGAGHEFFNTVGVAQEDGESHPVHVPHTNYGLDSSVAATIGSGPSSVTSESTKSNAFRIYPGEESDVDRLVTKALVLGDFDSAVALCLSSDRFADAILLAVRGGPELLQRTQKAYFERRTTSLPSLRLFQSIITNDLSDIVQNADLQEWREIFVVLCTFASLDEFSTLAEQLGRRLEYEFTVAQGSDDQEEEFYRKNATLTYLAASRLERLVSIWADELFKEEKARVSDEKHQNDSSYSAHAHALQTFVEKVTVFRAATNYKDEALTQPSTNGNEPAQAFKLAALYDRYFEYADLLCTQGLVNEAVGFLQLTPSGYKGSTPGSDFSSERKGLIDATTTSTTPSAPATVTTSSTTAAAAATSIARPTTYGGYTGYTAPAQPAVPQQQPSKKFIPYETPSMSTTNPYGQSAQQVQQSQAQSQYGHTNASAYAGQYIAPNALTQPPHLRQQQLPPAPTHLPPRAVNGPPPPPKRDSGGWNDAPATLPPPSRIPAALPLNKPPAITSPFPNAAPSPGYSPQPSPFSSQGSATLPPPPRPGSVTRGQAPPTQGPPPGHRLAPQGSFPVRPPSQTAGQSQMAAPARTLSPGGPGGPPRAVSRSAATPPARAPPAPPKYPAGDRSHIPDHVRPAYEIISENLNRIKHTTPGNQRLVDDLERRINPLFDALNCDTISKTVVDQLLVLTKAMESRDRPAALAIHVDLLTRGSQTDDIGLWMSGIKQLILRL